MIIVLVLLIMCRPAMFRGKSENVAASLVSMAAFCGKGCLDLYREVAKKKEALSKASPTDEEKK